VELQTQTLGRIQHKLFEGVLKEFIFLYRNKTHPKYFLKLKIIYIYIYKTLSFAKKDNQVWNQEIPKYPKRNFPWTFWIVWQIFV
jgi:hypothetical protein